MIRYDLLLALRSLRRNRGYALLNSVGLTLGLAVAILVLAYLGYERAFDQHLPHADRTYRMESNYRASWYSTIGFGGYFNEPIEGQVRLATELEAEPTIEVASLVYLDANTQYVEAANERFDEDRILFTVTGDATTDIFGLDFIAGDPATALDRQMSAVLTEETALRYFGTTDAVGQTIARDTLTYQVTGVIAAPPATQHIRYDLIVHERIPNFGAYTYVRLVPGADVAAAESAATRAVYRVRPARAEDPLHKGERLTRVTDLRLADPTLYDAEPPADARYLYLFGIAAILLLAIAASNYANLSVALYQRRSRDIGVRKAMGAGRGRLIASFFGESVLLSALCLIPAYLIAWITLGLLNSAMGVEIAAMSLVSPPFVLLIVVLALVTGLIAGAYPALVLSRAAAVDLFGGRSSAGQGSAWMRRALVGAQFALLVGLASGAWVVQRQVAFIGDKDLGFQTSGVVHLQGLGDIDAFNRFKAELSDIPAVRALGTGPLPGPGFNRTTYRALGSDVVYDDANLVTTDLAYFDVMQIPAGDALGAFDGGPDRLFFANRAAADRLGLPERGGQVVMEPEYMASEGTPDAADAVAAILPDWHLFSLREEVRPLFVSVQREPTWIWNAIARVDTRDLPATMEALEAAWNRAVPTLPFAPRWVDEDLASLYEQEQRAASFSTVLSILAVVLTLLGLIGVVAYAAARRRKEIGVRKVLGAHPAQLVALLTRELVAIVGVAFVVGAPVAYWLTNTWLGGFAYRVALGPLTFVAIGLLLLVIALGVTAAQTWRAASVNPATVLRDE